MKSTLTAIQSALQSAAGLNYIADTSIYITPDESLFYLSKAFPQIAITDGPIEYEIEEGESWEHNMDVAIMIYQVLKPDDQSLMGNDDPLLYGVLDIADDIHAVLFDNKLSISGMEVALPSGESESQFLEGEDISIIKKTLYYEYRLLEANP